MNQRLQDSFHDLCNMWTLAPSSDVCHETRRKFWFCFLNLMSEKNSNQTCGSISNWMLTVRSDFVENFRKKLLVSRFKLFCFSPAIGWIGHSLDVGLWFIALLTTASRSLMLCLNSLLVLWQKDICWFNLLTSLIFLSSSELHSLCVCLLFLEIQTQTHRSLLAVTCIQLQVLSIFSWFLAIRFELLLRFLL